MKRCPECGRNYNDDSMSFCLDDGSELLFGPASMEEPATAIMNEFGVPPLSGPSSESATRSHIDSTNKTAVLPTGTGEVAPGSNGFDKRLLAIPILLAIIALGGFFGYRYFRPSTDGQIRSIAVLPFENRSGNADTDYLSDGLADSLIYRLSQLPDLKVSPTSSVMRYKGKEIDVDRIAQELNVDAVMSGRLVQRGDDLNISVQLIDVRTQKLLWAEQYDRKISDLLAIQRAIAVSIVDKLQQRLGGTDVTRITKNYTSSSEAYQLYLKGRFSWNKRTKEGLTAAIKFYNEAIEKDPSFALAYSGLAETYVLFSFFGVAPAEESMPKAKAAIDRALSLDDSLAEAHAAYGNYLAFFEFDRGGSEREYRRAIELNPNFATAHHWLGINFLSMTRQFDDAIAELKRAAEIDPQSLVIGTDLANILTYAGRYDDAILQARQTLELDPGFPHGYSALGDALSGKGQFDRAIEEYERSITLSDDGINRALLVRALVQAGRRSDAERQLTALRALAAKKYVPDFCFAIAQNALGNKEMALDLLEKEVEKRSSFVVTIGVDPALSDLRGEPRFKAMLKRMNLPE